MTQTFHPQLTYTDDDSVRLATQGIDLELSAEMLELAVVHDGLELTDTVARDGANQMLGTVLSDSIRVELTLTPVSEAERLGLDEEDDE